MKLPFVNGSSPDKYSKAEKDENSLGNILLELGYVTREALEQAVGVQKSQSMLGQVLVKMGPEKGGITESQLEVALREQELRQLRPREIIKENSRRHKKLLKEVQDQLVCMERKYAPEGEV